jgi:hypothetical protein
MHAFLLLQCDQLFSTGGSVCSHLLTLADYSTLKMEAILSFERPFTQDIHSATSQKTTFLIFLSSVSYFETKYIQFDLATLFPFKL